MRVMVNNADWLDELRYIPLLRDIGRHFSVNRMLTRTASGCGSSASSRCRSSNSTT